MLRSSTLHRTLPHKYNKLVLHTRKHLFPVRKQAKLNEKNSELRLKKTCGIVMRWCRSIRGCRGPDMRYKGASFSQHDLHLAKLSARRKKTETERHYRRSSNAGRDSDPPGIGRLHLSHELHRNRARKVEG